MRRTVSVIIPFYNITKFLDQTLLSLREQAYKGFEIILIDDGSTCSYPDYIRQFSDLDIKLVKIKHGGVSAARNKGLTTASGEYISFLDSDDMWLSNKLSEQIKFMLSHLNYDGVYTDSEYIDSKGRKIGKSQSLHLGIKKLVEGNLNILNVNHPIFSSVLVKKSYINEFGLFDESLHVAEDWDFLLRKPARLGCIHKKLCLYRRHPNTIASYYENQIFDKFVVVKRYFKKFPENNFMKPQIKSRLFLYEFTHLLLKKKIILALYYLSMSFLSSPWMCFKELCVVYRRKYKRE